MKTQITELFGMQVYTDKAVYVGAVDDVVLDVDGKKIDALAIGNLNQDLMEMSGHRGVKVPFRIIKSIGDIVIIRHLAGAFHRTAAD